MNDLMTKGEIDLSNMDLDDPRIELEIKVYDDVIIAVDFAKSTLKSSIRK